MQFGVCCDPAMGLILAEAGYDYIELNVQSHLVPRAPENDFLAQLDRIQACPLPCSAANAFIPGDLKIVGPEVSTAALEQYVQTACQRAARAGIRKIVFGSGGARHIPDGTSREDAWRQLLAFGRMCGPIAEISNVIIAVEPLNFSECNVLNTVSECSDYVREVNHPAVTLLVDAYHVARNNENPEDMIAAGDILRHVHIATCTNRRAPGLEDCDFAPFFSALKKTGYDGDISIEGGWDSLQDQAEDALRTLRLAAE